MTGRRSAPGAGASATAGTGGPTTAPLLDARDLQVFYDTDAGPVRAVDGVDLVVAPGEALGLVGESGCGKTTAAKGVMRLLPPNGRIAGGSIGFDGRDLATLDDEALRRVRWAEIAWISQAAMNALDPVYRVGDQIVEAIQAHRDVSTADALARAADLFRMVGIDPQRLRAYPFEMSGGMKQRSVIAMAMALDPKLIIADEPTTALDVVTQAQILARMQRLRGEHGMALLFITHDISVVMQTCDSVAVMYGGLVMERGPVREVFRDPIHPYTMGLKNAFPTLEGAKRELVSIPGAPPNLLVPPTGCRFAERCPFATDRCREERPELVEIVPGRLAACHYPEQAVEFRERTAHEATWATVAERLGEGDETRRAPRGARGDGPLVEVDALVRHYPVAQSWWKRRRRDAPARVVHALDGVSFAIRRGEILGLAGESGSGKTTTGETLVRLQAPTAGHIRFAGEPIEHLRGRHLRDFRRHAQMVFQDPYETLNPRLTIEDIVGEPLTIHRLANGDDRRERVVEALERSGLKPADEYLERFPHELSGGQRQRVAIARAIVLEPDFLVADEPVSMLDVSIRAGVLNLLRRFRDEDGISIVYVSHDLPTIRYVADRTAIMYLGQVVEIGPTESVIQRRLHPYTQLLLEASPEPDPDVVKPALEARGEIPSAIDVPNGCRFHTRCPLATPACGWEGRDVEAALAAARVVERDLSGIDATRVDALDLWVTTADADGARERLTAAMAAVHPNLVEASEWTREDQGWRLRFAPIEPPPLIEVAPGHQVACVLVGPEDGGG
ncbi:MAG: ABC transporter ATP-binding protein [Trueperaceae bacterium]|nr:ABC transporter ATP-binding protein [Trueperaceae bacterium]